MTNIVAANQSAWLSSAGATFLLIALAEFGDKSQLVCMSLAARHRGLPVALGAVAAFALLNLLAVLFGAAVAAWLPEWVVTITVAVLFALPLLQIYPRTPHTLYQNSMTEALELFHIQII
jgi:putative Ca2+/H+ antiporter (TMEM165/GDT1 family)